MTDYERGLKDGAAAVRRTVEKKCEELMSAEWNPGYGLIVKSILDSVKESMMHGDALAASLGQVPEERGEGCPHPLPHYTFPPGTKYEGRIQCEACGALIGGSGRGTR